MMKNYTVVYLFNPDFEAAVAMLRKKQGAPELVDSFPAHLSVKRRFELPNLEDGKKLIEIVAGFKAQRVGLKFDDVILLGDVVALKTNEEKVVRMHGYLLNSLKALGINPGEYEAENFLPHITLWREVGQKQTPKLEDLRLPRCETNKLCLFEIDPTSDRAFAKRIVCVSSQ